MDNKKITIADIAEEMGVSKTTVSRAISGKGRIGEETRNKILQYIEEHDYKPNIIAKGLAKSCTYNIGVVMPEDYCTADAPFFINCLAGLHETAASKGYDILVTICNNEDMANIERMIANRKVDGIILMRSFIEDQAIKMLKERGIPFVVVGSSKEEGVVQVDQDNEGGCRELTSILLMKKLSRIALIGGNEDYVVTQSRLNGFLEAFQEMERIPQKELIYMNRESAESIEQAVEDILEKGADCIVCMDDNICIGVLNKLKKSHISVPKQMKVASFFNSSFLENNVPSITSLSFNVKKLGMSACKMLIKRIEKDEIEPIKKIGYELVLKESTK
ncbi:MAG: LacI family DNA-binding transcriptional regulator [Lachnospiraceae bacterium]|nr:LacI family DNA-binding transcriptional regulator [Lachnospiraceae bacterium]